MIAQLLKSFEQFFLLTSDPELTEKLIVLPRDPGLFADNIEGWFFNNPVFDHLSFILSCLCHFFSIRCHRDRKGSCLTLTRMAQHK
jgi:hypothetical protein